MLGKLRWVSALALAGTVFTTLLAAQTSWAAAEVGIPRVVLPDTSTQFTPQFAAPQSTAPRFVSQPVVQPLPAAKPATGTSDPGFAEARTPATSLGALVAAQPSSGTLGSELRCLAGAIYFEARGETLAGQLAVARVVVDRASSGRFPASYCGVVYQPDQFSFVRGRSMPGIRTASNAWREAVAIARIAHEGSWTSPTKGALFFHSARVTPGWRLTRLARVDNHIFYR